MDEISNRGMPEDIFKKRDAQYKARISTVKFIRK
jgi:hypothetical protein